MIQPTTKHQKDLSMAVKDRKRIEFIERTVAEPASSEQLRPIATLGQKSLRPNRGMPLNLDWVEDVAVNTSAVERRTASLVTRRTVKKQWQAAWLLRAIT